MNKTILIVDDEQDLLDLMEIILEAEGYNVIKAINGKEALVKISTSMPDLVLLDVMMPIMDGWQVLKNMRKDARTENIPVVMVTAKIGIEDKNRGLQEGASDYIGKPFSPKEVLSRIKSILQQD
ncbi:MAG: response regulator [Blastocatellia bacterium]|nr:response regulator [Blastocatellia bacterium]